jgi:hypothetical protein
VFTTTDETLIGTTPKRPMTNQQRRAHRRLAAAEQTLIGYLVTYDVHPEDVPLERIEQAEQRVARYTRAWKRACRRG